VVIVFAVEMASGQVGYSRRVRGRRAAALWVAAGIALFCGYLRLSDTYAENSDMANILLMGSDLLHGNLLLHGWHTSDVSFYPTELVQYALLDAVLGVRMTTAHVAAAMTYTMVVLLAVALARGGDPSAAQGERTQGERTLGERTRGERTLATLLTGGLLLAPQLGTGVYALDVAVGHIGTAVPLLVTWLLLDRAGRRWWVPPAVTALLAWVLVADPVAEIAGVAPLLVAAGGRFLRRRDPYDAALAVAALAGYLVSLAAGALLRWLGGYVLSPLPVHLRGLSQLGGIGSALCKVLVLFGADWSGLHGVQLLLALLHLAGVALAAAACWVTARGFRRDQADGDDAHHDDAHNDYARRDPSLVDHILLAGIVFNVGLYLATLASIQGAHEIAVVAPYAAALAGRTLARPLLRTLTAAGPTGTRPAGPRPAGPRPSGTRAAGAMTAIVLTAAGYLSGFGYELTVPASPPQYQQLATWLDRHHFTAGLGGYWESSSVTVETGGRVLVRPVLGSPVRPYLWMADTAWYDPARGAAASFVIAQAPSRKYLAALAADFGPPAARYQVAGFTILAWPGKNLLHDLGLGAGAGYAGQAYGTTITGQHAFRASQLGTEPIKCCQKRLGAPMTSASALNSRAIAASSRAGWPRRVRTCTSSSAASAVRSSSVSSHRSSVSASRSSPTTWPVSGSQ
jgi:hypothetical protein